MSSARCLRFLVPALCACALLIPGLSQAQSPSASPSGNMDKSTEGAQPASTGGAASGSPHPPQLDSRQRPITAGGFVSSGPVVFQDVSEKAGITSWTHKMGSADK